LTIKTSTCTIFLKSLPQNTRRRKNEKERYLVRIKYFNRFCLDTYILQQLNYDHHNVEVCHHNNLGTSYHNNDFYYSVTKPTTPTSTSATTGNWWDSLGKPQYGGQLTASLNSNIVQFDPYLTGGTSIMNSWIEQLWCDDWTLDPKIFAYGMTFRPPDYVKGNLALSWEMPDTSTFIAHLRQGIHWQNIPPVNGREFTSDDVVWNFDRMYGLGGGFTKPSVAAISDVTTRADLTGVTATDKYTVVFKMAN